MYIKYIIVIYHLQRYYTNKIMTKIDELVFVVDQK